MTARQLDFITRLAQERQLPLESSAPGMRNRAQYVSNLTNPHLARSTNAVALPTTQQASAIIEWLLELPLAHPIHERTRSPRTDEQLPEVPEGRYALRDVEGAVSNPAFYKVDRPTEGRWAGYTFVKELSGDNHLPIRDRASKSAILTAIAEDVMGAAKLFGTETCHCARCGRRLTDDTSRSIGIGPDCREAWGV